MEPLVDGVGSFLKNQNLSAKPSRHEGASSSSSYAITMDHGMVTARYPMDSVVNSKDYPIHQNTITNRTRGNWNSWAGLIFLIKQWKFILRNRFRHQKLYLLMIILLMNPSMVFQAACWNK
ncbi:hypothetical protein CsSME_00004992 [Camellia sinensis var. sinensis]